MSCGIGHRLGSDPVLLWLWHRPAATAPTRSLAWEPPYAVDVALKRQKTKKITQNTNCLMQKAGGVGGWDLKNKKTFTNRRGKTGRGGERHEKITASRVGGAVLNLVSWARKLLVAGSCPVPCRVCSITQPGGGTPLPNLPLLKTDDQEYLQTFAMSLGGGKTDLSQKLPT